MDSFFINLIAILVLINLGLVIIKKFVSLYVLLKTKVIKFRKEK